MKKFIAVSIICSFLCAACNNEKKTDGTTVQPPPLETEIIVTNDTIRHTDNPVTAPVSDAINQPRPDTARANERAMFLKKKRLSLRLRKDSLR